MLNRIAIQSRRVDMCISVEFLACSEPNYVLGTKSSTQRLASRREGGKGESPLPPIRRDSPEESCVSETEQSFNLLELNSRSVR